MDPEHFRGRLDEYLAYAADHWQSSPLWCPKHWAPCPVDGKPGLVTTIIMQIELMQMAPADVGDATGMNSWALNRTTPLCCELGDEKMKWLWEQVDAEHCHKRPPEGHPMYNGRVCYKTVGHLDPCEWENPGSIFDLMEA